MNEGREHRDVSDSFCDRQHDDPIHHGEPCAACGVARGVHLAYLLGGVPHYFCNRCKADCTAMMGKW